MKKRTDEEKLQLVNEACRLMSESFANLTKAMNLLHLCGIDLCDNFCCKLFSYDPNSRHAQIFKGISKLERIIGKQAQYGTDTIFKRPDKSRKLIEHNGVKFLQLGEENTTSKYSYR